MLGPQFMLWPIQNKICLSTFPIYFVFMGPQFLQDQTQQDSSLSENVVQTRMKADSAMPTNPESQCSLRPRTKPSHTRPKCLSPSPSDVSGRCFEVSVGGSPCSDYDGGSRARSEASMTNSASNIGNGRGRNKAVCTGQFGNSRGRPSIKCFLFCTVQVRCKHRKHFRTKCRKQ